MENQEIHRESTPASGAREYVDEILVRRPRRELYAFWRDFANAPKFMRNVQRVTAVDALSSVWTVKDASGRSAEWEFIVTDDEPDRLIAWATSGHTPVKYVGRVEFRDGGTADETQVIATLRHDPPPGIVDSLLAKVSGDPDAAPLIQSREDLLRFKTFMEQSDSSPKAGRRDAPALPDPPG
jgi:uncharacterized membrane protein